MKRVVTIDIESNSADIYSRNWRFRGLGFRDVEGQETYTEDLERVQDIIEKVQREDVVWLGHNLKFDLQGLMRAGLLENLEGIEIIDTMVGMNLLDENIHEQQLGLKKLVKRFFKHNMVEYKDAVGNTDLPLFSPNEKDQKKFDAYGKDDVHWTWRLWDEIICPRLSEENLMALFTDIYMPAVVYVAEMEAIGVRWSKERTHELVDQYTKIRNNAYERVIKVVGHDVGLRSPKLGTRLFDDLHYDSTGVTKTPKTGRYQLNDDTLEMLAKRYPLCADIVTYRSADKMIGTYLSPNLEKAEAAVDTRLHASYWQVSATGRKRASKPNIQNQPVIWNFKHFLDKGCEPDDLNIRTCLVPASGCKLIVADLSQAQLRLLAHVSGDEALRNAYQIWRCSLCKSEGKSSILLPNCPNCGVKGNENSIRTLDHEKYEPGYWHGIDVHQQTADIAHINRSTAKNCNFAMSFGASPWLLSKEYGNTVDEWNRIQRVFFHKYKGLKRYHMRMEEQLFGRCYVTDMFGRRRRYSKKVLKRAERDAGYCKHILNQAVNAPIQSAEAHYLMMAINQFRQYFIEVGVWRKNIWLIAEIHDEVVLECDEWLLDAACELIEERLRYAYPLSVPMNADIGIFASWGHAKG